MIFIYTCKARLTLALQVYDMLWNVPVKKFIVYGDTIKPPYVFTDKYLVLNVGDDYENLTEKTKKMFQVAEKVFPGEPVLKMDDDILPNSDLICQQLQSLKDIYYAGRASYTLDYESIHHIGKVKDEKYNVPMYVPSSNGVAGPMYYLRPEAIRVLNQSTHSFFYEDVTVGYSLNQSGIHPTDIKLYDDHDIDYTFHNHSNHKKLYVRLHGGLGNQLFQVASGYGIAKKHNMILILVSDYRKETFPHQEEVDTYNKTLFSTFRIIHMDHLPVIDHYYEMDNVQCFRYNETLGEKPIYIEGYLQTEKYFKDYRQEIIALFKPYNLQLDSYFIHVRRGDFLKEVLYKVELDDYYTRAIQYIESIHSNTHYYIVSDDIDFCKKYPLFASLNKTFVEGTMEAFSIMSSCKGGICSNSTFSWWGSYLIDREKTVLFPKQWINNGHENKDIYYEGSIIL
jgi:hypothetical protein